MRTLHLRQGCDYLQDGCAYDLLGNAGFLFAIRQILRVKEGGLVYWGLPCDSFSFMASSVHQRTVDNPFGSQHHRFVVAGNVLATRMSCLILLCIVRRVRFFIEQPDRSAAFVFPYIMHIMSFPQLLATQRVFWCGTYLLKEKPIELNQHSHNFYISLQKRTHRDFVEIQTHCFRHMGYYGGWSQKPQLGVGNWCLVGLSRRFWTYSRKHKYCKQKTKFITRCMQ